MKALILHSPKKDNIEIDNARFSNMISSLNLGGINGKYYSFDSKELLQGILFLEQPDIVFSADYFTKDSSFNRVNIHSILEELHIPYIGSKPETLEFVLAKSDLKIMWRLNNLTTPDFFLVSRSATGTTTLEAMNQAKDYPYILKPNCEGNSRGLDESSIVFDQKSLESKLTLLLDSFKEVLIEKFLGDVPDLREFTVAMIGNGHNKLLMPAEITFKKQRKLRVITTKDKDNHNTQATLVNDLNLSKRLTAFADKAFEIAGVLDYSRCDLILAGGQLYALEINGQPMIPDKWFEICASGANLDSTQYINAIFLAGIVRNNIEQRSNLSIPSKMEQLLPKSILDILLKQ